METNNKYDSEFENKLIKLFDRNKDAIKIFDLVDSVSKKKKKFSIIKIGFLSSLLLISLLVVYFFLFTQNNNITKIKKIEQTDSNNTTISETLYTDKIKTDSLINSKKEEIVKIDTISPTKMKVQYFDSLLTEFTIKVDNDRFDIFDIVKIIRESLTDNNFKISNLESGRSKADLATLVRSGYSSQQDTIVLYNYVFSINLSGKENVIKLKLLNNNIIKNIPLNNNYSKENSVENDFYLFMKDLIGKFY